MIVTTLFSHRKFFCWHPFSQFASNIFLDSVLRSFEAYNASYHFIHQQCCLLVTKDCHNLIFASQVFSLTCFWNFAFSIFVNSVSRSFEVHIASYHLIHHQWCLLVTRDSHYLIFTSLVFSLTFFWQLASSNFVNSVLRSFAAYDAPYHFIHQNVVCCSSKMVTTLFSHRKFFCWHPFHSLLLATSWFLFYEALKLILPTTSFINGVVCWSPKMVTILSSRRKFFRCLSGNSLFEISWILFYEALRHIMLLTTSFINSVVCCSPKMVKILYSHRQFFADIFLTVCFQQIRDFCTKLWS